jgi:hypothetical protein
MIDFWLSPIKEDICEEEEMTILDYNNEFKQTQNKEDLVKFSSIIKEEDFLLNQGILSLEGRNLLIHVTKASKFFYAPKQEYLRFFFEGLVLAFFEEVPEYRSHIKRKLKMKDITHMDRISQDQVRLNFGNKDFIEFKVLEEPNESESLDEIEEQEELIEKVEFKPKLVVDLLEIILRFLKNIGDLTSDLEVPKVKENKTDPIDKKGTHVEDDLKSKEKMKSILKLRKEISSVTNLDKRQSAMYMNRHSREEFMEAVGKSKLASIEEEDPEMSKEKIVFIRARVVFRAIQMVEKDFLELDLMIHEQLEEENNILQQKTRKVKKKFLKATKHLQKILKYSKGKKVRTFRNSTSSPKKCF